MHKNIQYIITISTFLYFPYDSMFTLRSNCSAPLNSQFWKGKAFLFIYLLFHTSKQQLNVEQYSTLNKKEPRKILRAQVGHQYRGVLGGNAALQKQGIFQKSWNNVHIHTWEYKILILQIYELTTTSENGFCGAGETAEMLRALTPSLSTTVAFTAAMKVAINWLKLWFQRI